MFEPVGRQPTLNPAPVTRKRYRGISNHRRPTPPTGLSYDKGAETELYMGPTRDVPGSVSRSPPGSNQIEIAYINASDLAHPLNSEILT
ncbi:hypothetical protein QC763_0017170 [Podospora pseudopauciseta]|uniref:Uncharacterized protein n=1 Tax=Podospora pseudopauciseta TaxID=2093780 RepID=A0ABR0I196_9PEZI|nr:hypothetical protein QC763_0017170 [Podospora pseudopauciseta]